MKVDVIYDSGGDWVALYVNGEVRFQGHSISDDNWKSLLRELAVETNEYQEADFSDLGSAPDYLDEVEIKYG